MSDEKKTFTGVLTDAEDGKVVLLEESPSGGLLLAKGKNKIHVWPDQLKALVSTFMAWQD